MKLLASPSISGEVLAKPVHISVTTAVTSFPEWSHGHRIGNSVFPDHCGDDDPKCMKFGLHLSTLPFLKGKRMHLSWKILEVLIPGRHVWTNSVASFFELPEVMRRACCYPDLRYDKVVTRMWLPKILHRRGFYANKVPTPMMEKSLLYKLVEHNNREGVRVNEPLDLPSVFGEAQCGKPQDCVV